MEKTNKYLIESNWWLLKIFASKNPLRTIVFVIPISIFWLFQINSPSFLEVISGVFLGLLIWSFMEYAIHRWVFHILSSVKIFRYSLGSFHLYHHGNVSDPKVYTSGLIPALFWSLSVYGLLRLTPLSLNTIHVLTLTSTVSYFAYEWVHYYVHVIRFENKVMRFLQDFHLHHHLKANKNYGQTSHIWDVLLGTYEKADTEKVDKNIERLFIKHE